MARQALKIALVVMAVAILAVGLVAFYEVSTGTSERV
jgi:hypothetical protein